MQWGRKEQFGTMCIECWKMKLHEILARWTKTICPLLSRCLDNAVIFGNRPTIGRLVRHIFVKLGVADARLLPRLPSRRRMDLPLA